MRQAIKAPLVIPVLGLLVASAMAASPAAAADPDTCDPDSLSPRIRVRESPRRPGRWRRAASPAPATLAGSSSNLLRPGRLHRAQGRRHASGAVRVRDRTRRDRRLRPRADGSPGRIRARLWRPALPACLRERTRPWRGPQRPAEYVEPAWRRSLGTASANCRGHRLANGDAWCAVGYQGSGELCQRRQRLCSGLVGRPA